MSQLPDPTATLEGHEKEIYDALVARRGRIDGMYRSLLNHPELTEHVSNLGTYLRFQSTLPGDIREFAILYAAHQLKVPYEWVKHVPPAEVAGLPKAIIDAIANDQPVTDPYVIVAQVVKIMLNLQSIPEPLQNKIIQHWTVKGLLELSILIGFYRMIAGVINAFDVQLPK